MIQNGQPTYPHDPVVVGDFSKAFYSGDGGSVASSGVLGGNWTKIDLNATGLTWIQKGAGNKTKLCVRISRDIAGEAPPTTPYQEGVFCTNLTNKAYLRVTWLD
jgi:hypothetical protein